MAAFLCMRFLFTALFSLSALAGAQPADESLVFLPMVKDLGRYLQSGRRELLSRWSPTEEAAAQLASRVANQQPWSETTPPVLRLVQVVRLTASDALLAAEESSIGAVTLRRSTRVLIRLEKAAGHWRLVSYAPVTRWLP